MNICFGLDLWCHPKKYSGGDSGVFNKFFVLFPSEFWAINSPVAQTCGLSLLFRVEYMRLLNFSLLHQTTVHF